MKKRLLPLLITASLLFILCSCGKSNSEVSVQRVDRLTAAGQAGDRFAGMVVSEHVEQIPKDANKTVLEVYVTEGQTVATGDKLFSYDSASLELEVEKQQLELEKLKQEKSSLVDQIADLQKQLKSAPDSATRARLTLEINTLKTNQMENDYQLAAKEKELEALKETASNSDILSPIDGTIRQINDSSETGPFITIQQSGAFKIKGTINEMSLGSKLSAGTRVRVVSRIDPNQTWMGTVTSVDMQSNTQNTSADNGMASEASPMTTSSSYPFYVELDDTEGLLLGQHVYMEVVPEGTQPGVWLPSTYLTDLSEDSTSAKVWADNGKGKLAQRDVTLGTFDELTGCYEILSGLTMEDYVADPAASGCQSGASVVYRNDSDFGGDPAFSGEDMMSEEDMMPDADPVLDEDVIPEEESIPEDALAEGEGLDAEAPTSSVQGG